ncbi:MAG: 4-hydroxy-tetrahydrodipicolinate reductase [Desulfovibrio sp.]|nr:MAG: 4-hydroxy-tetrahydrodipicolinate reductase [Desulfovibrio sp.]
MSTQIVINGALGRMGTMIIGLAAKDPELELAGVVERPTCKEELGAFVCTAGTSMDEVLPQTPGAVVIDFTAPEHTVATAQAVANHGNPMVSGTTGLDKAQQAELAEVAKTVPLLWAPNMSVGVNVLLKVLPELVRQLGDKYDMEMVELHHNKKKDAPSGTAIKLGQCLAEARGWDYDETVNYSREGIIGERPHQEIGIQTIRGGDVAGVHTMYFMGPGERIEVTHQAHSREVFAQGALRAAKWLATQQPGKLYAMADIL